MELLDRRPQLLIPFSRLIPLLYFCIRLPVEIVFDQIHQIGEELLKVREAKAFPCFEILQGSSPLSGAMPQV